MDIYQLVPIIRDLEKTQLECIIYKVTIDVTLVIKCIEKILCHILHLLPIWLEILSGV